MFDKLRARPVSDFLVDAEVLSGDESVSKALGSFQKTKLFAVLAEEKGSYGVLHAGSLLKLNSLDSKVSGYIRPAPKVGSNDRVGYAAKIMVEKRLPILPVVDATKLVGAVRADEVLKGALEDSSNAKISAVMTPNPICLSASDLAAKASKIMSEKRIDHLPILQNSKISGVITSRDLVLSWLQPSEKVRFGSKGVSTVGQQRFAVANLVFDQPVISDITHSFDEGLKRVIRSLSTYTLVTMGSELQGIVTLRDFLKPIADEEPRIHLPVNFSGLPTETIEGSVAKDKLKSLALRLSKNFPDLLEVKGKVKSVGKTDKKFEVRLHLYCSQDVLSFSETGYDLVKVFEELEKRAKRSLSQTGRSRPKRKQVA
jgi:CBS domain-containing protein